MLIDKHIEVAQKISDDYKTYKDAEKVRGIILSQIEEKANKIEMSLRKSKQADKVRSVLSDCIHFKKLTEDYLLRLNLPKESFTGLESIFKHKMLLLCLSRILKKNIDFYHSSGEITEDQLFSLLSKMKIEENAHLSLYHSFWSLQITQISQKKIKSSDNNLILSSELGFVLVKKVFKKICW